mmetsp:Transcript_55241/g.130460  ORF Transcript_55241/g.130460 Transcript_55241/m.130460 type:complete len:211 (+) Transcript_55241:503-1135(+)
MVTVINVLAGLARAQAVVGGVHIVELRADIDRGKILAEFVLLTVEMQFVRIRFKVELARVVEIDVADFVALLVNSAHVVDGQMGWVTGALGEDLGSDLQNERVRLAVDPSLELILEEVVVVPLTRELVHGDDVAGVGAVAQKLEGHARCERRGFLGKREASQAIISTLEHAGVGSVCMNELDLGDGSQGMDELETVGRHLVRVAVKRLIH